MQLFPSIEGGAITPRVKLEAERSSRLYLREAESYRAAKPADIRSEASSSPNLKSDADSCQ